MTEKRKKKGKKRKITELQLLNKSKQSNFKLQFLK